MKFHAEKDGQDDLLAKVVFILKISKFSIFRRITIYPSKFAKNISTTFIPRLNDLKLDRPG
jgi:hypothetical protein